MFIYIHILCFVFGCRYWQQCEKENKEIKIVAIDGTPKHVIVHIQFRPFPPLSKGKSRDRLVYEFLLPIIGPTMIAAQNATEFKNDNKQSQGYSRKCASAVLWSGLYCMRTYFDVSDSVAVAVDQF
jgi:hypothetical protein